MKIKYSPFAFYFFILFITFFSATHVAAQTRQKIAFQEVLRKMETCKDSICEFKNLDISVEGFDPDKYVALDTVVESLVTFENCTFLEKGYERSFPIIGYIFKRQFSFLKCRLEKYFYWSKCTFEQGIALGEVDINSFSMSDCEYSDFYAADISGNSIHLERCNFTLPFPRHLSPGPEGKFQILFSKINSLLIDNAIISARPDTDKPKHYGSYHSYFGLSGEFSDITLNSIKVLSQDKTLKHSEDFEFNKRNFLNLSDLKCDNLKLIDCDWGNLPAHLSNCAIHEQFTIVKNKFNRKILFLDVVLPDKTNIDWNQIGNWRISSPLLKSKKNIIGKIQTEHFDDNYAFTEIISIYARLLEIYRKRGDNESATGCYVEMKDLQSRYQQYLYQKDPTLKNYFDWKIQVFLKFFCDYGSDPVKSLLYSCYLMGFFAILYFIFPSETDNLQRSRWMPILKRAMRYFQNNIPMNATSLRNFKSLRELVTLKRALVDASTELPAALRTYGLLLYRLHLAQYAARRWAYSQIDISRKPYVSLSAGQRRRAALGTALFLTAFLAWGFFERALHAAALSMNAFVTLGYGEIEARGIARYLAVLEGVCGWFLLSIFSVSLINNVMQ